MYHLVIAALVIILILGLVIVFSPKQLDKLRWNKPPVALPNVTTITVQPSTQNTPATATVTPPATAANPNPAPTVTAVATTAISATGAASSEHFSPRY